MDFTYLSFSPQSWDFGKVVWFFSTCGCAVSVVVKLYSPPSLTKTHMLVFVGHI